MRTLRLAWLLSRPGAATAAVTVLPIVAFGVATALLLVLVAGTTAFWGFPLPDGYTYRILAVTGLVLVAVPLTTLGASAARLSARRRDERLATLRLLGAGAGQVAVLTVLEATVTALVGAIAGVVGYVALVPLVGLLRFDGAPLGVGALWLSPLVVIGVVAAVAALAAVSAAVALQRVVVSPLGVRTRQTPHGVRRARIWIGLAVVAGLVVAGSAAVGVGGVVLIVIGLAVLAGGLWIIDLVGPAVLAAHARGVVRRARTADRLMAARTVLESPRAAWRQVSGVAIAAFTAVVAGGASSLAEGGLGLVDPDDPSVVLFTDIRTGVYLVLAFTFLMVACSVGVSQAAAVLDRRSLWVALDRAGMPVGVMESARRRAVLGPLVAVAVGAAVVGGLLVAPFVGVALVTAPITLLTVAASVVAGIVLVATAVLATRPVLLRVLREPARAV